MKPPPFAYIDPESLPEALQTLAQYGDDCKVLAGGQSLVPLLNMRLAQPDVLVDLNRLHELDYIREEQRGGRNGVAIGAMTRQRSVESSSLLATATPILVEGIRWVGHDQIRNRGTVGGSIAHADPAAELPLLFRALDGVATVAGSSGSRIVPAADFFLFTFSPAIEPDEMLTEVWFPSAGPRTGYAFLEVARRHGDFALVAVAVTLSLDAGGLINGAHIAMGGAAPTPIRAEMTEGRLVGKRPSTDVFLEAGLSAANETDPAGDVHADAAYRKDVVGTLTSRALAQAYAAVSEDVV